MSGLARQVLRRLVPRRWKPTFDVVTALALDHGHLRSGKTGTCVDAAGAPIPWYTYPAIEYLRQLDFRQADVFEYGSGHSTLFWASRANRVVSVEDDRAWHDQLSRRLPSNCELILETDLYAYPAVIDRVDCRYDVIVIDGAARGKTRLKCARRATARLRDGGLIILDNADWLPESARLLRDAGLIEVDMAGFAPLNGYTSTTSLFLHRAFRFGPRAARHPQPPTASWPQTWETPTPTEVPTLECGGDVFGGVRRNEPFTIPGPRVDECFRLVVSERRSVGVRTVAILDERRERVLLSVNEPMDGPAAIEAKIAALSRLPWDEFLRAVNGNDLRRYDLEPTSRAAE